MTVGIGNWTLNLLTMSLVLYQWATQTFMGTLIKNTILNSILGFCLDDLFNPSKKVWFCEHFFVSLHTNNVTSVSNWYRSIGGIGTIFGIGIADTLGPDTSIFRYPQFGYLSSPKTVLFWRFLRSMTHFFVMHNWIRIKQIKNDMESCFRKCSDCRPLYIILSRTVIWDFTL